MPTPFKLGLPLPGYRSNSRAAPTDQFVDVSGTDYRAYGIDFAGRLWAWGNGPLGDGLFRNSAEPVLIDDGPWRTVRGSYGIKQDGSLWVLSGRIGGGPIPGYFSNLNYSANTLVSRGVTSIELTEGLENYRNYLYQYGWSRAPQVQIDPPDLPGGQQATAIAHVSCSIHAVEILSGGYGYDDPPTVELVGVPSAVLRAYVTDGAVTAIAIVAPGNFSLAGNQDDPPELAIRSSSGHGASARAVFMCGVTRYEITSAGSGYKGRSTGVDVYEHDSPLARYLLPTHSFSKRMKGILGPGRVVGLEYPDHAVNFTRTVPAPPYGAVYTRSGTSIYKLSPHAVQVLSRDSSADADVCAFMEFALIDPSRLISSGPWGEPSPFEAAARRFGSLISLNDDAFIDTPEVSVVGGQYGSGAEVSIEKEDEDLGIPGHFKRRYIIKITARGSGYDYRPMVRVSGTSVRHKYVFGPPHRVEVLREVEADSYYDVLVVSPREPPPLELASDAPGVSAVATTVLEPSPYTTGEGGWPLMTERVVGVTVTDESGGHHGSPIIRNATGTAMRPRSLASVHPQFARDWQEVRSGINNVGYSGMGIAIDVSGVVWTWGDYGYTGVNRDEGDADAPRPIGAYYVVEEAAPGLTLWNPVPPSPVGFYAHVSEPSGVAFQRFSPPPPIRKLAAGPEDRQYPSGFHAISQDDQLVGFSPRTYNPSETISGPWAWYDDVIDVGLCGGVLQKASGKQFFGGPGQTAVDCRGGVVRTPDGGLALLDRFNPGRVRRWIGGQAIEITDRGENYRGAIFAETPAYDSATIAVWPPYRGGVYAVGVVEPGGGYQFAPSVTIDDAEGFGAYAEAVIEGPVDLVTVTSGGSGYTSSPKVAFSRPGIDAEAVAEVRGGQVVAVRVTDGGLYRSPPEVTFIGGGGSGAAAVARIDGRVEYVKVLETGSGYTQAAVATVPGGAALQCQVLCRYAPPQSLASTTVRSGYAVAAAAWANRQILHLGAALIAGTSRNAHDADRRLSELPYLYTSPPTITAAAAPILLAVTKTRIVSQAFSLPLYREMQERNRGEFGELAPFVEWSGVLRPQDVWLPTLSTGTQPGYWWYFHDGELTADLLSVDGYGARARAIRNPDGTIARWEWEMENATPYTASLQVNVDRRRSLVARPQPYDGVSQTRYGMEARVRGPAEGRPASAVAVVEEVVRNGETRYKVLRIDVLERGKYRVDPSAWLVAGEERASLRPVMSSPLGPARQSTSATSGLIFSPAPSSYVPVGGRRAPSGNYYEQPLLIGDNRTYIPLAPRYREVESLEQSSPERLWRSPPRVEFSVPPNTDQRWYAGVTAPPDALPLGVRFGAWQNRDARRYLRSSYLVASRGDLTSTTGDLQLGFRSVSGFTTDNCILPLMAGGELSDVWIVNNATADGAVFSYSPFIVWPTRMNESDIVFRGECGRPARARVVRPKFATGNEFVQAAFASE